MKAIQTETITPEFARRLEVAEIEPWFDMWESMDAALTERLRTDKRWRGAVAMLRSPVIPFTHFNQIMGLGLTQPATEPELDEILEAYRSAGIGKIELHVVPQTQPAELVDWLEARGLRVLSAWDRIYRCDEPLEYDGFRIPGMSVEKVTEDTADEWATFLTSAYHLEAARPMARSFAVRKRWHHYLLRQNGRLVALRSQYIHDDGTAWWGVEAPVPGLMTLRFDLDQHLCGEMILDGLRLGVKLFVGEVELVSPTKDHDGYKGFAALGFKHTYLRTNYSF